MSFSIPHFLIGLFLANSIPHLVMGLMEIRFLSLFGLSAKANLAYSLWNVCLAAGLSIYFYGLDALLVNGMFWGVFFIFISYVFVGRYFYLKLNRVS